MKISYLANNLLRPLGRNYWGFSCGIFGNGFALSRKTLLELPFNVDSLVEDLNYHLDLLQAGKSVKFISDAYVLAEMPIRKEAQAHQRAKWEKGRMHSALFFIPKLIPLILKGKWKLIEPLLDLLTMPLSYHLVLILVLMMIPEPLIQITALFSFIVVIFYIGTALKIGKAESKDYLALIKAPYYLIWKIALLRKIFKKSPGDKDRTQRKNEILK
jgi:cellulose synthase/poly-beta-1,6-N-acetylglucosamine synthase-like glycosyltransferase